MRSVDIKNVVTETRSQSCGDKLIFSKVVF